MTMMLVTLVASFKAPNLVLYPFPKWVAMQKIWSDGVRSGICLLNLPSPRISPKLKTMSLAWSRNSLGRSLKVTQVGTFKPTRLQWAVNPGTHPYMMQVPHFNLSGVVESRHLLVTSELVQTWKKPLPRSWPKPIHAPPMLVHNSEIQSSRDVVAGLPPTKYAMIVCLASFAIVAFTFPWSIDTILTLSSSKNPALLCRNPSGSYSPGEAQLGWNLSFFPWFASTATSFGSMESLGSIWSSCGTAPCAVGSTRARASKFRTTFKYEAITATHSCWSTSNAA